MGPQAVVWQLQITAQSAHLHAASMMLMIYMRARIASCAILEMQAVGA